MFRLAQRADRPKIMKTIEKKAEELVYFDVKNRESYKYFVTGFLILGGVAVNNYDSILSFLQLSNFRFAKKLFGDRRPLDSTVKIDIPKEVKIIFLS